MFWLLAGAAENGSRYPDYDQFTVYRGDESGSLLSELGRRFASDAPACRTSSIVSAAPSPFVRVRRAPRVSALGWRTNDD